MRISGLELVEIRLPLRTPFVTHLGVRSERRILLVRAESAEAEEGWGECAAGEDPSYTYETTETARHVLEEFLLPRLAGSEIGGAEDLRALTGSVRGHPAAKAALEGALWDLQARERGLPLWELLGGSGRSLRVGVSLGLCADARELVRTVGAYLARGYARVKLKIRPGQDLEPVRAVRERFPDLTLSVDANGSYGLEDIARLKELDAFGLHLIEQPLGHTDLAGHARLQEVLSTPVCLDESIRCEEDLRLAVRLGACRVATVKPPALGGLASARSAHDHCVKHGIPAWVGGMLDAGIGKAQNLALATLPGFSLPGDLAESARHWEADIVDPPFSLVEGAMHLPRAPGIGVRPDRERIAGLAVGSARFGRLEAPVVSGPAG